MRALKRVLYSVIFLASISAARAQTDASTIICSDYLKFSESEQLKFIYGADNAIVLMYTIISTATPASDPKLVQFTNSVEAILQKHSWLPNEATRLQLVSKCQATPEAPVIFEFANMLSAK